MSCRGCQLTQIVVARDGRLQACPDCGQPWEPCGERRVHVPRQRPARVPLESRSLTAQIDAFVRDVLAMVLGEERVEQLAYRGGSGLAGVLHCIELGVVGDGNRGTKGVGRIWRIADDRSHVVDPSLTTALRSLPRVHQVTVEAVQDDGRGNRSAIVVWCERQFEATLAQRLGMRLASASQRRQWERAIVLRDTRSVLSGTQTAGQTALRQAAQSWATLRSRVFVELQDNSHPRP